MKSKVSRGKNVMERQYNRVENFLISIKSKMKNNMKIIFRLETKERNLDCFIDYKVNKLNLNSYEKVKNEIMMQRIRNLF